MSKRETSHLCTLGVVCGGVQRRGRAPLSGVEEAVLPARGPGIGAVAAQDHGAAQETESRADPAGVQREAKRHQTLVLVSADGEPDSRYDATHSWKRGVTEEMVISTKKWKNRETNKTFFGLKIHLHTV